MSQLDKSNFALLRQTYLLIAPHLIVEGQSAPQTHLDKLLQICYLGVIAVIDAAGAPKFLLYIA